MQQTSQTTTAELRDELRDVAETVTGKAGERVHSEIDSRKASAATQVRNVSSALEDASTKLSDGPAWIRSAAQHGTDALKQFADTIEHKDSRQLAADFQSFGRNRPGLFLAGCAVAGFAASRILKAGVPPKTDRANGGMDTGQATGINQQPGATAPYVSPQDLNTSKGSGFANFNADVQP